jgi:hypoxanthine phosphoribosyltransferase
MRLLFPSAPRILGPFFIHFLNFVFTTPGKEIILSMTMKLLLSEKRIQRRVGDLARQISKDFADRELLLVGVLKGAFIFMADLARKITGPVKIDFVRLASYGSGTCSSGKIRFTKDLEVSLKGKDVLIVEDIIDTGVTLEFLRRRLKARRPRSLAVVTLLDKPSRRKVPFQADYTGFQIPDHFVVGYGLDCAEEFRNLRGIYKVNLTAAKKDPPHPSLSPPGRGKGEGQRSPRGMLSNRGEKNLPPWN